jgi:hypothetical protein
MEMENKNEKNCIFVSKHNNHPLIKKSINKYINYKGKYTQTNFDKFITVAKHLKPINNKKLYIKKLKDQGTNTNINIDS